MGLHHRDTDTGLEVPQTRLASVWAALYTCIYASSYMRVSKDRWSLLWFFMVEN